MMKQKPTLTALIVCKNEALRIGRAIDSVKTGVDRVVIYDTGSEDKTIDVCKKHCPTARVIRGTFDCFVDTYNRALEHVTTSHVLHLAADEWFENTSTVDRMFDLIRSDGYDTVDIIVKDFNEKGGYSGEVCKPRIFPSSKRYAGPYTHEYIPYDAADRVIFYSSDYISHQPNKGDEGSKRRAEQDRYWLEKYLQDHPNGVDVERAWFYLYKICLYLGDEAAFLSYSSQLKQACKCRNIYQNQLDLDLCFYGCRDASASVKADAFRQLIANYPHIPAYQYFASQQLLSAGHLDDAKKALKMSMSLPRNDSVKILCENAYYYTLYPLFSLAEIAHIEGDMQNVGFYLSIIKTIDPHYHSTILKRFKERTMWNYVFQH